MPQYVDPVTGKPLGAASQPLYKSPLLPFGSEEEAKVYVDPSSGKPLTTPTGSSGPRRTVADASLPVGGLGAFGPIQSRALGQVEAVLDPLKRFASTYGSDLVNLPLGMAEMLVTPPAQQALQSTIPLAQKFVADDKAGLAAAAADVVSPIPVTPVVESAQQGQVPETLAHLFSGLTFAAGMGKALGAANKKAKAKPEPTKALPKVDLPPEFVPVGEEPAVKPTIRPDPAQRAFEITAEKKGMGLPAPEPAAPPLAPPVETAPPSRPYVDPATGRVLQVKEGQYPLFPDQQAALFDADLTRAEASGPVGPDDALRAATQASPDLNQKIRLTRPDLFTDQRGAVMPGTDGGAVGPIWYSRLEKAMEALPDTRNGYHPDKLRSIAAASTSADELKWTGFNDFLAERKGKPITKQEVLDFLRDNKLEVEEKILTDPNDLPVEATQQADDWGDTPGVTKYHPTSGHSESLSLPGGRNYRELLIKFPSQVQEGQPYTGAPVTYQSPHWAGEENVLAHVRFNDRTAPDGAKTLHIEEIQSDWHQAGREKGYATGPVWIAHGKKGVTGFGEPIGRFSSEAAAKEAAATWSRNNEGYAWVDRLTDPGVPDAPFQGNKWQELAFKRMLRYAAENGYDRLTWTTGLQQTARYNEALGRALGEGAIRWSFEPDVPTGSSINAQRSDWIELLHPKTDELIWMGPSSELTGMVGKDLATQILADIDSTPQPTHPAGPISKVGTTLIPQGPDVKVGSPGMVQQYDRNLPGFVSKYVKQWGGVVKQGEIPTGLPQNVAPHKPPSVGTPLWQTFLDEGEQAARHALAAFTSDQTVIDAKIKDMQKAIDVRNIPSPKEKVWSVDLTPEMRGSVMQGQPLGFAKIAPLLSLAAGSAGAAYGAATGDDPQSRLRRGLAFGALGAAAPFALVPRASAKRLPITDSLPHEVRTRLTQQGALPHVQTALQKAWQVVRHDMVGDLLNAEHGLRRAGFGEVADAITTYKTKRMDILTRTLDDLRKVVEPLQDPSDYRDFWAVVRLRRDLNSPPGVDLEGKLDPRIAAASLQVLENRLQTEAPQVLQAAQNHRDLMRSIGQELVASGEMDPLVLKQNDEYFPDYVLAHLTHPDSRLAQRWPLKYGVRGFLKKREGGERETLRDYAKVILKYTTQVREGQLKDELVSTLARPAAQGGLGLDLVTSGQVTFGPRGQLVATGPNPINLNDYKVFKYRQKGPAYVMPKEVVDRLVKYTDTPGPIISGLNRVTGVMKGVILRSVWGAYNLGNFLGDSKRLWDFDASWNPIDVVKTEAEAARAVWDMMHERTPQGVGGLGSSRGQALAVAQQGKEIGLGVGAATAEGGSNLRFDPKLRRLVTSDIPGSPIRNVISRTGDILVGLGHAQDVVREYLENVPRTAKFMMELKRGNNPEVAGKITRKVMIDYADLTPFEERVMRGFLAPFYCLPEDSEILTREGWKTHHTLKVGEEVMTYNLAGDHLEWQPCEEVAVFDHDQPLMTFDSHRVSLRFTPDHRWVVRDYAGRTVIKSAKDLNTGDDLLTGAEWKGDSRESLLSVEDARLLGWLMTDGYWRNRGGHLEAVIYQHPKKFLAEVMTVGGGTPRSPHPDSGVVCVPVPAARLSRLRSFLTQPKADTNFLPLLTRLSREALDALWDAAYKGDGTTNPPTATQFVAAQIPSIREALGFVAYVRGFRPTLTPTGLYLGVRRTTSIARGTFGEAHYQGKVWCPRTANSTWVTRQNGFVSITGNTFYKKNFASYTPGLAEGPVTGTKTEGALRASNALAKNLALTTAAVLWNTTITPEAENSLSEHEKNQFHLNIPYGEGKVVMLGIPGPANFAAKTVGLGGAPRRMLSLIKGKSSLSDEVAEMKQQAREASLGLITPLLSEPYAQLQGEDLRTGRNIVNPLASAGENLQKRVTHLGEAFTPAAQMFRASKETGGDFTETAGEAAKRYLTGNFVQPLDIPARTARRVYEAVGKADARRQADTYQLKAEQARSLVDTFEEAGLDKAKVMLPTLWEMGSGREKDKFQAIVVDALKKLASSDKRWAPLATEYQLKSQDIGPARAPYIVDELQKLIKK